MRSPRRSLPDQTGSDAGPKSLPEERRIHVRTMNVGVAARAGHAVRRSRSLPVDVVVTHLAVTLVAQRVDVRHIQQPGILRTVRRVARQAAFTLHRRVLIHKGSTNVRVALGADCILIGGHPQIVIPEEVVIPESPVHVMAVAALDNAFVHLVVKGHAERGLDVGVTLEAQVRLLCQEQGGVRRGLVDAVAA